MNVDPCGSGSTALILIQLFNFFSMRIRIQQLKKCGYGSSLTKFEKNYFMKVRIVCLFRFGHLNIWLGRGRGEEGGGTRETAARWGPVALVAPQHGYASTDNFKKTDIHNPDIICSPVYFLLILLPGFSIFS